MNNEPKNIEELLNVIKLDENEIPDEITKINEILDSDLDNPLAVQSIQKIRELQSKIQYQGFSDKNILSKIKQQLSNRGEHDARLIDIRISQMPLPYLVRGKKLDAQISKLEEYKQNLSFYKKEKKTVDAFLDIYLLEKVDYEKRKKNIFDKFKTGVVAGIGILSIIGLFTAMGFSLYHEKKDTQQKIEKMRQTYQNTMSDGIITQKEAEELTDILDELRILSRRTEMFKEENNALVARINKSLADSRAKAAAESIKKTLPTNPNAAYSLTLVAVDNLREPWNIGGNKEIKLEGMTDEIMLAIVGEESYKHLLQNTDSGYEPIGDDNAVAAKWTRIPVKIVDNNEPKYNLDKISQLAKYCSKLQEYAGTLCDNNFYNRELTHLAIRRHVK